MELPQSPLLRHFHRLLRLPLLPGLNPPLAKACHPAKLHSLLWLRSRRYPVLRDPLHNLPIYDEIKIRVRKTEI